MPHGVILAGTPSWRGCALDEFCSRALLPLLGRPVIAFIVDWFRRSGIEHISICGNGHTDILRAQLGDGNGLGVRLEYYEDDMPRGTAGCIRDATLQTTAAEIVAVDTSVLTDINLRELLRDHRRDGASVTLLAGKNSAVPGPRHVQPAGIYIISKPALDHIPAHTYQDIKEMWIPRLYHSRLKTVSRPIPADSFVRILSGRGYLRAVDWAIRKAWRESGLNSGFRRIEESLVHASARIAPSARLAGSCVLGPGCRIGAGAAIMGPTVLGTHSVVGQSCVVSEAAAWHGVHVGAHAVVNRSILVSGSTVDSGTVVRDTIWGDGRRNDAQGELYWWPCEVSLPVVSLASKHGKGLLEEPRCGVGPTGVARAARGLTVR
ncbi:MAG: NDP-sugar synthase [Phycisphaerae bacterium]|nr:NDP-sugar synthase [Phycisphaerae bacterium]